MITRGAVCRGAVAALLALAACTGGGEDQTDGSGPPSRTERPAGGSVRVAVWSEPDPTLDTAGGRAVRALTRPALFVATPDGGWDPMLVEPGSETQDEQGDRVSFRLRRGAAWSDGTPITVDDLRRTADERFVVRVEEPTPDGTITVALRHPIRGWQRLWSGGDAIAPPEGLHGGPFRLASHDPGLEAVLVPDPGWWGAEALGAPLLDEVRLVLVPDPTMAGQLVEQGRIDVLAPFASTNLEAGVDEVEGYESAEAPETGTWFGLRLNPDRLSSEPRAAVAGTVDRDEIVNVMLRGEAFVLDGLGPPGLYEDVPAPWAGYVRPSTSGLGSSVDLVGYEEVAMTGLVQRSMQVAARAAGGAFSLRNGHATLVTEWLATDDYASALVFERDHPWPCWTCRFGHVDAALAAAADGGDVGAVVALQERLRDQHLLLPLWRPVERVMWSETVGGVEANGYAESPAWNAWEWWRAA